MDDIIIRYVPMELTVPAVTSKDENGDYNLYVNCNVGYNAQQYGIKHEINHIQNGHFEADLSVKDCEAEAERR